ncbi:O-methyltransferase [Rummeliibacillus stabekisii]|uniref:O-methyltransferase n=1 Tax=Rummeliibacillus stabekisii TaxID=241244 RepID=UPI00203A5321|nr:O-methyltransferase [Rummeliibacillus stabekisii]MCM3316022.1 O-methyltransferase [Rummeliibacillus stabekisii]
MAISDAYTMSFIKPRNPLLTEMEQFAKENFVPIMQLPAIELLLQMLRIQQPKSILEIGTAIGYSAIRMAEALPETKIVSIERDENRLQQAKHFLSKSSVAEQVEIITGDALEVDIENHHSAFDAIFIDAAKGQYQKFFEKYSPLIKQGGIIYIDNMYMHGLSDLELSEVPRRKRTMIRNLHQFADWMIENEDYQSTFFPVGDGLLICIKR